MSLKIEGRKCPICNGYLFEEDEIVWCPECGAPHHKHCFNAVGHCGFEEFHKTEKIAELLKETESEKNNEEKDKSQNTENEQNTAAIKVRCPYCGEVYSADAEKCPKCSAPNAALGGKYYMFDALGGVKPEEDIGEGVTANTAKNFVMVSTNRFIPKFAAFKKGKKHFFSWWSFLFPAASLAARKMYGAAVFSAIIQTAATVLFYPLSLFMTQSGIERAEDMYAYMQSGITKEFSALVILAFVGMAVLLVYKIISALMFDKLYYKHMISKVKQIESNSDTGEERLLGFRKYGGLNVFSFLITVLILQYLPSLIAAFIL